MLSCGVDIGTTNLKVVLIDEGSRVLWTRVRPTPHVTDDLGVATDPLELLDTIEDMIIEGCSAVAAGRTLSAIATSGIGEDGVCLDAQLRPLAPAIPWFDERAKLEADEIAVSRAATPRAGIKMESSRSGAKWLWMRRHQPEVASNAMTWATITDYPLIAWGGRTFISETLASRTGCLDVDRRQWIPDLLTECGAPPLPEVVRGGEVVGSLSRGRILETGAGSKSTLLVAGGHDHPVAASAIQRIVPNARVDSLGTANVVYGETTSHRIAAFDSFLCFVPPVRSVHGLGCIGVYEFAEAVKPLENELRRVLAMSRIPGEPGCDQKSTPMDSVARTRRVLETACFTARRMFEAMDRVGVPAGPVYATGGWSRSKSLLSLRASVYGAPIAVLSEQEPTVVGAALLAAEAAGASVSFCSAVTTVDPIDAWVGAYAEVWVRSHSEAG
jgi:xylulokinase